MQERDDLFRADVRADLEAGIHAGQVRPDVEPVVLAVALVGQLRGIGLQRLLDPAAATRPAG